MGAIQEKNQWEFCHWSQMGYGLLWTISTLCRLERTLAESRRENRGAAVLNIYSEVSSSDINGQNTFFFSSLSCYVIMAVSIFTIFRWAKCFTNLPFSLPINLWRWSLVFLLYKWGTEKANSSLNGILFEPSLPNPRLYPLCPNSHQSWPAWRLFREDRSCSPKHLEGISYPWVTSWYQGERWLLFSKRRLPQ